MFLQITTHFNVGLHIKNEYVTETLLFLRNLVFAMNIIPDARSITSQRHEDNTSGSYATHLEYKINNRIYHVAPPKIDYLFFIGLICMELKAICSDLLVGTCR